MTLYKWSQTASADATADSTINWSEGQVPSSINDSARSMMAATAKYRDDISGAIVTSGTNVAYTIASYQQFDTLAHLGGQMIAFTPHATNGATVTLNVDSLGAKPLRSAPNAELLPGTIIQGTPYVAVYNQADGAFYLHGFYGNPYNIPLAASLDYWAPSAPNSSFAFPYGQAISRTTYATLFALVGTMFGTGDGATTFNLPDLRGRVVASPDNMGGGADPNRLTGSPSMAPNRNSVGGAGGAAVIALSTANLPPYTPSGSIAVTNGAITVSDVIGQFPQSGLGITGSSAFLTSVPRTVTASQAASSASFTGNAQGGTNVGVENMPPTILTNRIMRII
jgi:microcystin-dependent protein